MLFVYVSLVVVITNKSFALIYILPDKVLRWVGGTGEDTGQTISQVMGEAKGSFEKGSSTFGEFTKGITEAAGSDGTRVAGQLRKFKDGSGLG
jgi:defect-in-organelle-trafficking protein DotA